jgi:gliding motility-associated-like protein
LGSGADSFSWLISDSMITGADVIVQAPLSPGVHVVEITATNGPACSVIRTDTLIVLPVPAPLWNITDVSCAGGTDGTIAADSLSGSNLSIMWETAGLEGPVLTDLGQGTYITTVTDPFGCSGTDTLFVHMPLPLIDSLSTTDALCGEPVGVLEIHSASTSTGLTFQLNGDSMGTWMAHDLVPGEYGLLATDSVGCLEQRSFIISALGTITVNIVGDTVLAENGEAQLYCSVLPFDSLATYIWIPETGLDDPTSNSPFCTVTDTASYMVIATSYAGCKAEDTVLVIPWFEIPPVVPDPCGEAFLPNIFSPNHDGLNDDLCVLGGCFTSLSLTIYDRWGQRVYHSATVDACWDGTHGGTDLPSGAYAFTLYAERSNGDVLERTGTLTLKR